ncbi:B12-binding domain-containing protein [Eubacterium aggregans]|uniref:B12-binding domain-containing protein n=1 Tax=Eubacterium aggregans TaxID=81409 RepID=UPI003F3048CA
MEILKKIADTIYEGDDREMPALVQEALDAGCGPQEILDAMMEGMAVVEQEFK